MLPSRPLALPRFGFQGVGFKFSSWKGTNESEEPSVERGTQNHTTSSHGGVGGWVVVVKVETVEEGA